jgi:inner membrane protease subunit 1
MYPTIPSHPSYNILSRRHKHGKNIQVGDIIVFKSPIFPGKRSCKRVIGMPGDYVLRDPSLSHTVGGAPIPSLDGGDTDAEREEPTMVQVPEGHVWVAGDNLSYSRDSRFHGPVPMALIQGKTLYVGDGWFSWISFRRPQLQPTMVADKKSPSALEGELALKDTQIG